MQNYISKISSNINLEEGSIPITNILIDIYFNEGISTKELSRKNMLPLPLIAAIKKEFIKEDILVQDRGIRLTEKGRSYIEEDLGFRGLDKKLYLKLFNEPFGEFEELKELKKNLEEVYNARPSADVSLDQSKCTLDTAINRAVLLLKYSSLIGKKILCVGDDDMISLAVGFLLKRLFSNINYSNTHIFVMDIDKRILDYIKEISTKECLPIECIYADLKNPVDKAYENTFDCFLTDPPYTLPGMNLFISRGLEALKNEKSLPIFFSFSHKSPDFTLDMQKGFNDMGLSIFEVLRSFNNYEGAEIIGNTGQMIVLKTTKNTHPIITESYEDALYTGELRKTVREYMCTECGMVYRVGFKEDYKTIEDLKSKGCSRCKNTVFNLIKKENLT